MTEWISKKKKNWITKKKPVKNWITKKKPVKGSVHEAR